MSARSKSIRGSSGVMMFHSDSVKKLALVSLRQMEKSDVCFTLNHQSREWQVLNLEELLTQIQLWKAQEVEVRASNHIERKVGDETIYLWTVQTKKDEDMTAICPLALAFDRWVSGFTYISKEKKIGELVIRLLGKK